MDHVKLHFHGSGRRCKQTYGCRRLHTCKIYRPTNIGIVVQKIFFFIIHNFLPIFISLFLLLLFRTFDNETSETKIDDGSYRDLGYGGSLAEWLACWNRAQKDPGSNRSRDAVGEQS